MGIFSFFQKKKTNNIKHVGPTEFRNLMADSQVQLVDVRTAAEYNQRKIGKPIHIDFQKSDFEKKVNALLDVNRPVAIYCQSGGRSGMAAKILARKGFPMVYNLRGGILFYK